MDEELAMQCVQIIAQVGSARSSFIEAIHLAADGDYDGATASMEAGSECYYKGHQIHRSILQREAKGMDIPVTLLLVHSEDQLMAAEQFKILAVELINCHRKLNGKGEVV